MDYDWTEKVHRLNLHFKIPIFHGGVREKYGRNIPEPLETLGNSDDQLVPVEYYSTVISSTSSGVASDGKVSEYKTAKGYSLRMSVELVSANLWESPYTLYQQELYGIIQKLHDADGWNFKQISDWLNENGYKSPRGKTLKENHVWSIYIKKQRSIQRFSREYDHKVTDMKVDVVDIVPTKNENGI